MNISKQTVNIVNNVRRIKPTNDWDNTYIPHGINEENFYPINELDIKEWGDLLNFKRNMTEGKNYDFIVFWNNRNIRLSYLGML